MPGKKKKNRERKRERGGEISEQGKNGLWFILRKENSDRPQRIW